MTAARSQATAPPHLLLVDDDRLILTTLGGGLRDAGFRVSEAADGSGALELARRQRPDLAILDLRMPGLSGVETAQRLNHQGVPFIVLSAHDDREEVAAAAGEGALGYVVKPVDVSQLVPAIHTALERARDFRELTTAKAQLDRALAGSREISMAVGLLMERFRLREKEAFEILRRYARNRRRKVAEVAHAVLDATETLNALGRGLEGGPDGGPSHPCRNP